MFETAVIILSVLILLVSLTALGEVIMVKENQQPSPSSKTGKGKQSKICCGSCGKSPEATKTS